MSGSRPATVIEDTLTKDLCATKEIRTDLRWKRIEEAVGTAPGIAKDKEDRRMVRKIGTITAMVTTAVLMSPLLALAQDAGTAAALLQHPLRAGLIAISA